MRMNKKNTLMTVLVLGVLALIIFASFMSAECRQRVTRECRAQGKSDQDCLAAVCLECNANCPGQDVVIYND